MHTSWWMIGAVASVLMVGCAQRTQIKDDDIKLGRVPFENKEQVFAAEHNVSVAQANQAMAERAFDEAKAFAALADEEHGAAKARVEVARKAIELGSKTRDLATQREAQRQYATAQQLLTAVETQQDYAGRLKQLRQEEIDLANRQLATARLSLQTARIAALRKSGITPSGNEADLFGARDKAAEETALQESKVAVLRDEVARMKDAWERRRTSSNVAARNVSDLPPIKAPPAPDTIEPEPVRKQTHDYDITPPQPEQ